MTATTPKKTNAGAKTPADKAAPQGRLIPARQAEELTAEEKVARGEHAKRLLQDPMLKEAFANLKLDYFEAFVNFDPRRPTAERDRIGDAAGVITYVETHLRLVMGEGQVTQARIDQLAKRA